MQPQWVAQHLREHSSRDHDAPRAAPATPAPPDRQTGSRARIPVPAGTATLAAFSANGLFAGLSGLFLAITFHRPSHALAGATLFIVFSAGV